MLSKVIRYEVYDDTGFYGSYKDNMEALRAVNKLDQRNANPRMYLVLMVPYDWQRDLEELFNGPA